MHVTQEIKIQTLYEHTCFLCNSSFSSLSFATSASSSIIYAWQYYKVQLCLLKIASSFEKRRLDSFRNSFHLDSYILHLQDISSLYYIIILRIIDKFVCLYQCSITIHTTKSQILVYFKQIWRKRIAMVRFS
jgi:hypothetical protein